MTKYYQHAANLCVMAVTARDPRPSSLVWTEVQVVPVDAIVIRRDELPEVTVVRGRAVASTGSDVYSGSLDANPGPSYQYGLNVLAVAEYLREHPPVDEVQVKALADLLTEADSYDRIEGSLGTARRLVERGVRVEKP